MRLRAKMRFLLKVLCLVWMIFAAIIFIKNISLNFLVPRHIKQITDLTITDVRNIPQVAMTDIRNECLTYIDEQEILKKAWPPKAVPGDIGYGGSGVTINRSDLLSREMTIYDNGFSSYQVNQIASEVIPLRRNIILDMPECNNLTYNATTLPTVGVVLIFIDEMWTALMRTVFSILDAGPSHLITEIVLVDDASQKDHLGKPLDEYIKIFGGKVKIVRLPQRKGLISARLLGFEHVTGEVAVFLDGHCEVPKGWLEPLLHRIQQDDTVIAVPNTDVLDWETFKYKFITNKEHYRCGFEFNMKYSWIDIPLPDGIKRKTFADPIETPVHMGCCFAVSRRNFERLGRYDPGLEIWGCENLELSFKTWMCGGRLEIIPCSHIAHMYRPKFPYTWEGKPHIFQRNCLRVAEVWMDDYKKFYHDRISDLQKTVDFGDVSERIALRQKLNCRSFDWFVKEIHPELYIPINTTAIGRIANVKKPSLCFSIKSHEVPMPSKCNPTWEEQYLYLTKEKQIRQDRKCVTCDKTGMSFRFKNCHGDLGQWNYNEDNTITFIGTDQCITLSSNNSKIIMAQCNSSDTSQQWIWPRKSIFIP